MLQKHGFHGGRSPPRPADGAQRARLIDPIGHENVGVFRAPIIPVGAEHHLLPVGRKHRKRIENAIERDLFQARAVHVDFIDIEVKAAFGSVVGTEQNGFPVGSEIGRPIGFS